MPSRRDLLRWSLGATAAGCRSPRLAPELGRGEETQEVAHDLVTYFSDLDLPLETLRAFFDAHRGHGRKLPNTPSDTSRFYLRFLMSTDFFQHNERTDRPLGFVAYYDPYLTPCHNPLQRID